MFCSRTMSHIINKLNKRALRIAFDSYSSDFRECLEKADTIPVHKRNLRTLTIQMYKISYNLSPLFMRDMMTEICLPYNINKIND